MSPNAKSQSSYLGKRVVDLMVLAVGAVPALLVGLSCGAVVRATSPGPVLFRQMRIGLDGEELECFKFLSPIHT